MIHSFHETLLSSKNEHTIDTHNLDANQGNYTEFLKSRPQNVTHHMISFIEHSFCIFWNVYNEHGLSLLKESHKNKEINDNYLIKIL